MHPAWRGCRAWRTSMVEDPNHRRPEVATSVQSYERAHAWRGSGGALGAALVTAALVVLAVLIGLAVLVALIGLDTFAPPVPLAALATLAAPATLAAQAASAVLAHCISERSPKLVRRTLGLQMRRYVPQ